MRMLHFAQKMVIISCSYFIICMRSMELTDSFQFPGKGRVICICSCYFGQPMHLQIATQKVFI